MATQSTTQLDSHEVQGFFKISKDSSVLLIQLLQGRVDNVLLWKQTVIYS
jgi:hypothetical protein